MNPFQPMTQADEDCYAQFIDELKCYVRGDVRITEIDEPSGGTLYSAESTYHLLVTRVPAKSESHPRELLETAYVWRGQWAPATSADDAEIARLRRNLHSHMGKEVQA